jgi:GNAT superfamily N-acetyltransferase
MGIGGIPDAVLACLGSHSNLGVHTEMFSDGAMALAEAGVINGRKKTLLPDKMVTSFVMGSQKLYEWVHDNPQVEFRPSDFTNDPFTIARNERMIAINSALAVDLTGQVAADTLMGRFFSGIGGQVDFIRGAARSRGGKPIIALRSTAKNGTVSRIQPAFEQGAGVVTSRGDVHYVVTEYGVADLWGKSIRQRAMALIEVAHPDSRAELLAAAKQRRYVFADQVAPRGPYPWAEARTEELPDGTPVVIRPVRITDEGALQRVFYSLPDDALYRQAFGILKPSHEELQRLVNLDYEENMAFVAIVHEAEREDLVAMAEYRVNPATRIAEVGFAVRRDWQLKGIGTLLMQRLAEVAHARGLVALSAVVPRENRPMLSIFQKCGLPLRTESSPDASMAHVVATLAAAAPSRAGAK